MKREEIIDALEGIEHRATDFPYMTAQDQVAIAAKQWCSAHSNKGCNESCEGCWQINTPFGCEQHNMEQAYIEGAKFVLVEQISEILSHPQRYVNADKSVEQGMIDALNELVEQLKA